MRNCFKSTRDWTSEGWCVRRPACVPACVRECVGFAGIHRTQLGRSGAPRAERCACTHRVENKGRRAECDILRSRASFQHRLQDDPADWAPFNIARRVDARERRRAVCLSVSQRQIPGAAVSRPCDVAQYRWEGRAPLGASAGGRVHLSSHWVRDYLDSRVGLEWSAAGQHNAFAYARLCKTAGPYTVPGPGQGWSGAPLVS